MADFNHLAEIGPPVPARTRFHNLSPAFWLVTMGIFLIHMVLLFEYRHLNDLADGNGIPAMQRAVEEFTGTAAGFLLFPAIVWIFRGRRLWIHLLGAFAYSLVHSVLMYSGRYLLFPHAGLGPYPQTHIPMRFLMEMPNDLIAFVLLTGIVAIWDYILLSRERELFASRLQTQLALAQVQNLRLQLQPHFLFNTLHMISAVMYENLPAADAMLSRLSDLLRHTLESPPAPEVALEEELRTLGLYLSIMQARFEDRLSISYDVAPSVRSALVPPLLLQPLVENAIEHGGDTSVAIRVSAVEDAGNLVLQVEDQGRGLAEGAVIRKGIGLGTTEDRLRSLYGAGRLLYEPRPGGGFRVTMRLPLRVAPGHA